MLTDITCELGGSSNPYDITEHMMDSPKMNEFCYSGRRSPWRSTVPQNGGPPHFQKEVDFKSQDSRAMGWHRHDYHLTTSFNWPYSPWFFLSHVHQGCWVCHTGTTLPELAGRIRATVATITLNLLDKCDWNWIHITLPGHSQHHNTLTT
jgi:hypothetical protein